MNTFDSLISHVQKGVSLRAYVIGENGDYHTIQLAIEDWWISDYNIGRPLTNYFSSGPLSRTTQTIEWTETIKWK